MSKLLIADDLIEIDGVRHSYGALDDGAHAIVHGECTDTEKGLAVGVLALLDRLNRAGVEAIEAQPFELTREQQIELTQCFCAHCDVGDGICFARVQKMMGDLLEAQVERILA